MFALIQARMAETKRHASQLRQGGFHQLHWNVASGLASSAWSALASLLVVPFYLRAMGAESFGLIGFFTSLQGMLLLLDLGFSTTMNREVARSTDDNRDYAATLLRTLEVLYGLTAMLIGIGLFAVAPLLANAWFSSRQLSPEIITQSLRLMAIVIGLRWPVGLYLGTITGAGNVSWVNLLTIVITSLSTIGAVFVLRFIEPTLRAFLIWQIAVCLLHLVMARGLASKALQYTLPVSINFSLVPPLFGFSGHIAVATLLGVLVAQLDKLVLPRFVSLADVGKFGVAFLVSRLLITIITPVYSAFYPHLTALFSVDRDVEAMRVYRLYGRIVNAVLFSTASYIALFGFDIVSLWTGDPALAQSLRIVLPLLLAGSALNAAMYFPHALQLARGDSKAAVLVNLAMVVTLIPTLAIFLPRYGIEGAAIAWFVSNVANVVASVVLTHRRGLGAYAMPWLVTDFLFPLAIAIAVGLVGEHLLLAGLTGVVRLVSGLLLPASSAAIVLLTAAGSLGRWFRKT